MRKRSVTEIRRLTAGAASALHNAKTQSSNLVHHVYNYLHLANTLGASAEALPPHIHIGPQEAEAFLQKFGLEPHRKMGIPLFGLNPGAEYGPAKRWPPEQFAVAAAELQRLTGCCWVIFGSAADLELASSLAAGIVSQSGQSSTLPLVLN